MQASGKSTKAAAIIRGSRIRWTQHGVMVCEIIMHILYCRMVYIPALILAMGKVNLFCLHPPFWKSMSHYIVRKKTDRALLWKFIDGSITDRKSGANPLIARGAGKRPDLKAVLVRVYCVLFQTHCLWSEEASNRVLQRREVPTQQLKKSIP